MKPRPWTPSPKPDGNLADRRWALLAVLISTLWQTPTRAQAGAEEAEKPQEQAASQPFQDIAEGTNFRVVITGVQGIVQIRSDEEEAWVPAKKQMELGIGAEFRTGSRSAVRFILPPAQTITLDRPDTLKVINAIKMASNKVKTDLRMKYGRTRYNIQEARIEYASKIYSPSATLAVHRSSVGKEDTALHTTAWSLESRITVASKDKPHAIAMGGTRPTKLDTESDSATGTTVSEAFVDPGGIFRDRSTVAHQVVEEINVKIGTGTSGETRDIETSENVLEGHHADARQGGR